MTATVHQTLPKAVDIIHVKEQPAAISSEHGCYKQRISCGMPSIGSSLLHRTTPEVHSWDNPMVLSVGLFFLGRNTIRFVGLCVGTEPLNRLNFEFSIVPFSIVSTSVYVSPQQVLSKAIQVNCDLYSPSIARRWPLANRWLVS